MWEWHKRSLRVNTRLQRESAINTIQNASRTFRGLHRSDMTMGICQCCSVEAGSLLAEGTNVLVIILIEQLAYVRGIRSDGLAPLLPACPMFCCCGQQFLFSLLLVQGTPPNCEVSCEVLRYRHHQCLPCRHPCIGREGGRWFSSRMPAYPRGCLEDRTSSIPCLWPNHRSPRCLRRLYTP